MTEQGNAWSQGVYWITWVAVWMLQALGYLRTAGARLRLQHINYATHFTVSREMHETLQLQQLLDGRKKLYWPVRRSRLITSTKARGLSHGRGATMRDKASDELFFHFIHNKIVSLILSNDTSVSHFNSNPSESPASHSLLQGRICPPIP